MTTTTKETTKETLRNAMQLIEDYAADIGSASASARISKVVLQGISRQLYLVEQQLAEPIGSDDPRRKCRTCGHNTGRAVHCDPCWEEMRKLWPPPPSPNLGERREARQVLMDIKKLCDGIWQSNQRDHHYDIGRRATAAVVTQAIEKLLAALPEVPPQPPTALDHDYVAVLQKAKALHDATSLVKAEIAGLELRKAVDKAGSKLDNLVPVDVAAVRAEALQEASQIAMEYGQEWPEIGDIRSALEIAARLVSKAGAKPPAPTVATACCSCSRHQTAEFCRKCYEEALTPPVDPETIREYALSEIAARCSQAAVANRANTSAAAAYDDAARWCKEAGAKAIAVDPKIMRVLRAAKAWAAQYKGPPGLNNVAGPLWVAIQECSELITSEEPHA